MSNQELLNFDQINSIISIINRDYVAPQIEAKIEEIENSEEYKKLVEEIRNSDEFKESIVNRTRLNNEKLLFLSLYKQIKELNKDYTIVDCDDCGDEVIHSWDTEDSIKEDIQKNITSLENTISSKVLDKLKVNSDYSITREIDKDLTARLQLTTVDNLDTIINSMLQYIDIDKYLYTK